MAAWCAVTLRYLDLVSVVIIGGVEPSRFVAVFTVLFVLTAQAVGGPAWALVIAAPFAAWAWPQFIFIAWHIDLLCVSWAGEILGHAAPR